MRFQGNSGEMNDCMGPKALSVSAGIDETGIHPKPASIPALTLRALVLGFICSELLFTRCPTLDTIRRELTRRPRP